MLPSYKFYILLDVIHNPIEFSTLLILNSSFCYIRLNVRNTNILYLVLNVDTYTIHMYIHIILYMFSLKRY